MYKTESPKKLLVSRSKALADLLLLLPVISLDLVCFLAFMDRTVRMRQERGREHRGVTWSKGPAGSGVKLGTGCSEHAVHALTVRLWGCCPLPVIS